MDKKMEWLWSCPAHGLEWDSKCQQCLWIMKVYVEVQKDRLHAKHQQSLNTAKDMGVPHD